MRLSLTLALVASALALPEPRSRLEARGSETNATLYAYGTNSSGWPIVYGNSDGKSSSASLNASIEHTH